MIDDLTERIQRNDIILKWADFMQTLTKYRTKRVDIGGLYESKTRWRNLAKDVFHGKEVTKNINSLRRDLSSGSILISQTTDTDIAARQRVFAESAGDFSKSAQR